MAVVGLLIHRDQCPNQLGRRRRLVGAGISKLCFESTGHPQAAVVIIPIPHLLELADLNGAQLELDAAVLQGRIREAWIGQVLLESHQPDLFAMVCSIGDEQHLSRRDAEALLRPGSIAPRLHAHRFAAAPAWR